MNMVTKESIMDFSEKATRLVEKALAERTKDLNQFLHLLDLALSEEPQLEAMVAGLKGSALREAGNVEAALAHLEKAVKLAPLAKGSSRALFLSYLDVDNMVAAVCEGERFFEAFRESGRPYDDDIEDYERLVVLYSEMDS